MIKKSNNRIKWITRAWHSSWPVGVLALLCIAFYWDVLWQPADHIVAGNDLTNMFLHWLRFAVSSIRQGQFPLWNPHLFSGVPFVANPQPALFYPPTWLALLMPVTKAFGWIVVLHFWIGGAGMYAWLRSEGASAVGALVGGVVFAFSGYAYVRVYAGHLGVVTTGAWLPVILWAYRCAVVRRSWKLAVVGGVTVGLAILAGHTATFIYVTLGVAAYVAYCTWEEIGFFGKRSGKDRVSPLAVKETRFFRKRSGKNPVSLAAIMLIVGLTLAAVQLLPMAEFAMHSTRQAAPSYDFASRFSWPPGYLLTLLVPNFFGEPTVTGYWGDGIYDEFIFYVGVLPLLLALLGTRLRHRLKPFLLALGLGALLLAFGKYGGLHRLFYHFVPMFKLTRAPARAGFLFTLAAAALAGLTVTALEEPPSISPQEGKSVPPSVPPVGGEVKGGKVQRARLLEPIKPPLTLAVAGGAVLMVVFGFAAFAWGRESNPAAGRLWHQANQITLFLLFFLLSTGLLAAWRSDPTRRAGLGVLALGLVVLDLWTFGGGLVSAVPVPHSSYWRKTNETVVDPLAERVLPWDLNDFYQNGGMIYGLRSVYGYDPLVLERYETFVASRPDYRARTFDLLNAHYLMTSAPLEPSDQPDAPRLLLDERNAYVYERPNALPRAWVAAQAEVLDDEALLARIHEPDFDPRATALLESALACEGAPAEGEIEFVRYEGNRIEARVQSGGGMLVFSEVYYPGWEATVDGVPTQLVRADYVLRALCIPEGQHQVTMIYDPPLLKLGLAITGVTLLTVIVCAVQVARQRGDEK